MINRIHRMIIRTLPGPFFASLAVLIFLLLMQFLMRYLPDLVGKGLEISIIAELITYNLAYMVVLAVPMAVLIATLVAFGRLSESRAYIVVKSAGISLQQILWPVLMLGFMLTNFMFYFNHVILPEANFKARNLWQDIRRKQPGFELQPGVFYDGLRGYSIRADEIPPESNELYGVTIFDYTQGNTRRATIIARRGHLQTVNSGEAVDFYLYEGEMHQYDDPGGRNVPERLERLAFNTHRLRLDLSDFAFERSDLTSGRRTDRTMPTSQMVLLVDSLEARIDERRSTLQRLLDRSRHDGTADSPDIFEPVQLREFTMDTVQERRMDRLALTGLPAGASGELYSRALENSRTVRSEIESSANMIRWDYQRMNRYRVEIHKKYAIAVACLLFILIGAPLGLSVQRSGAGIVGGISIAIFLFYWVSLVQGEKLADRGILAPWVGMWAANIAVGAIGLGLTAYKSFDHRIANMARRLRYSVGRSSGRTISETKPDAVRGSYPDR